MQNCSTLPCLLSLPPNAASTPCRYCKRNAPHRGGGGGGGRGGICRGLGATCVPGEPKAAVATAAVAVVAVATTVGAATVAGVAVVTPTVAVAVAAPAHEQWTDMKFVLIKRPLLCFPF